MCTVKRLRLPTGVSATPFGYARPLLNDASFCSETVFSRGRVGVAGVGLVGGSSWERGSPR